jgi:hypothetical protein
VDQKQNNLLMFSVLFIVAELHHFDAAPGRITDAAPAPNPFPVCIVQKSKFLHFDAVLAPTREIMHLLAAPAPGP